MTKTMHKSATERLKAAIRDIPDFPTPGIGFKDITPLIQDGQLFRLAVTLLTERYQRRTIDSVAAIDARGFLFASAVAYCLGVGIVMIRKKGKLPYKTVSKTYDLEYGKNSCLEVHEDAIEKGQKIVIIDDVLATGGTTGAAIDLIQQLGGEVLEASFLIELDFLKGREKLNSTPAFSLVHY